MEVSTVFAYVVIVVQTLFQIAIVAVIIWVITESRKKEQPKETALFFVLFKIQGAREVSFIEEIPAGFVNPLYLHEWILKKKHSIMLINSGPEGKPAYHPDQVQVIKIKVIKF